ncbi:stage II sporulation protein M [Lachnospiraceae bacterium 54-53]
MAGFLNDIKFRLRRRPGGVSISAARGMGPEDRYLICFFAGLVAGTILANFSYSAFAGEAAYYLGLLDSNLNLGQGERVQLFGQVLSQRMVEVWIAWLIGLTAYAVPLFCFLTAGIGFSMGFVLSVITVQKGLMGLPVFFMTVMPQTLCYLPLWSILLLWALQKGRRFKLPGFLLLLALTVAGSACEAWLNPVFLRFVL